VDITQDRLARKVLMIAMRSYGPKRPSKELKFNDWALPPPAILEAYETKWRGIAAWYMWMAEREVGHQHFVENVLAFGYVVQQVAMVVAGLAIMRLLL
jgi:uncharacterized membrane protein